MRHHFRNHPAAERGSRRPMGRHLRGQGCADRIDRGHHETLDHDSMVHLFSMMAAMIDQRCHSPEHCAESRRFEHAPHGHAANAAAQEEYHEQIPAQCLECPRGKTHPCPPGRRCFE